MRAGRPPLVSVLAATALTLILVGRSDGRLAAAQGGLRSTVRAVFVPVESAGAAAFGPLRGAAGRLGRAGGAGETEAELHRTRRRAESESARADALAAENDRLAALLGLSGPAGPDGVAARVVSIGAAGPGGALLLDRGADAGVRPGMPVVAAGGLVGRVVEAGPRSSTVLPVTDPASAVGVRCVAPPPGGGEGPETIGGNDGPGRARCAGGVGVAQGRGGPTLRLDLLDPTTPVRDGDLAVTSGLRHSRFPAGLPVGRVTGTPGRFTVEPFAPPDRLEVVKVLRWEPEP